MKRWIILTTIILMLVPLVTAAEICEDKISPGKECTMLTPAITCTEYNYTILNSSVQVTAGNLTAVNESIYKFNFNQTKGSYIIRLCNGFTREMIVEGDDDMGSIAITLFILSVSFFLFLLPFIKREFAKNEVTNMIIKRACWVIAIYLMMLNSAIMATIADYAGLEVTKEMFRYMWFFGTAGYLMMGFLLIKTLFDVVKLYKLKKYNERMGN